MGSSSSKFKKYLQHGDEYAAMQVYQSSSELRKHLQPSYSYGDHHDHNTPLHYAARHGMKHLIRAFLSDLDGGDPNRRNALGQTALHCACDVQRRPHKSPSALERKSYSVMLLLSWHGPDRDRVNVNARDRLGNTAAHYAARSGLRKCMEYLLAHGAVVFLENRDGLTPCDLAVREGHHHVAQLLESRMVFSGTPESMASGESVGGGGGGNLVGGGGLVVTGGVRNSSQEDEEEDDDEEEVYCGLRAQDLQEAKEQLLVEVAEILQVPLFSVEALLRNAEWSRENLLRQWESDPVETCQRAGVQIPAHIQPTSAEQQQQQQPLRDDVRSKPNLLMQRQYERLTPKIHSENSFVVDEELEEDGLLCELCCDLMSPSPSDEELLCGHRICPRCWTKYLHNKIREGAAGTDQLVCPAFECENPVPVTAVERHVSPGMARKLLKFDIKAFVETNKTIRWCPYPGCQRAVSFPDYCQQAEKGLPDQGNGVAQVSHSVDCGAGHFFCWECGGEAHAPVSCSLWNLWLSRCTNSDPTELVGLAASSCLWLITQTRECPSCRCTIQKSEGCNRTRCPKCRSDFCWVCSNLWGKHANSRYGRGYHTKCNRYSRDAEKHEQGSRQRDVVRFAHFYSRYKNHGFSRKLEEPLMHSARTKRELLQSSLGGGGAPHDTKFYEDGVWELLKARTILCSSYAYGFFLVEDIGNNASFSKQRRSVFEGLQGEMEAATEKLSEVIARPYLHTPRHEIIQTILSCRKKRQEFLKACYRGLGLPDQLNLKSKSSPKQHQHSHHLQRQHHQKQHLTLDETKSTRGSSSNTATLMRSQVSFMVGVDIDRKRLVESISDHLYARDGRGALWRAQTEGGTQQQRMMPLQADDSHGSKCRRPACLDGDHRCQHRAEVAADRPRYPFRSLRREPPKMKESRSSSTPTVDDDDDRNTSNVLLTTGKHQTLPPKRSDRARARKVEKRHLDKEDPLRNYSVEEKLARGALPHRKENKYAERRDLDQVWYQDLSRRHPHFKTSRAIPSSGGGRLSRSSKSDDNILSSSSTAEELWQSELGKAQIQREDQSTIPRHVDKQQFKKKNKIPSKLESEQDQSGYGSFFVETQLDQVQHSTQKAQRGIEISSALTSLSLEESRSKDTEDQEERTSVCQLEESPGVSRRSSHSRRKGSGASSGSGGKRRALEEAEEDGNFTVGDIHQAHHGAALLDGGEPLPEEAQRSQSVGASSENSRKDSRGSQHKEAERMLVSPEMKFVERGEDAEKITRPVIAERANIEKFGATKPQKKVTISTLPKAKTEVGTSSTLGRRSRPRFVRQKSFELDSDSTDTSLVEQIASAQRRASHESEQGQGKQRTARQTGKSPSRDKGIGKVTSVLSPQDGTVTNSSKTSDDGSSEPPAPTAAGAGTNPTTVAERRRRKRPELTIKIHNSSFMDDTEMPSDDPELEALARSPTLHISGVCISKTSGENRSSKAPRSAGPSPKTPASLAPTSPGGNRQYRSSSLVVPPSAPAASSTGRLTDTSSNGPDLVSPPHSASMSVGSPGSKSLHLPAPTSPRSRGVMTASAGGGGGSQLQFTFPDSASSLSTVLHVRDSHLSNDDFHEALFFGRSPKSNKKKRKTKK